MAEFVDRVVLHVKAGDGGHGCASIHREKFKPLGGPDGGNGGRGGDVILEVDANTSTLLDYHHRPHRRAESGRPGMGSHRDGANGADVVLPVPNGTVVKDAKTGEVLVDLVGIGTRYVAAAGGQGGLGNAALASPKRKAPGFALLGEPGEEHDLILELKTVADVALVGFPNAGKSSLIAALSAARPKIADYPFTTLVPNLGVVTAGDVVYTVADVPGLIPGASQGKGLGHEFLRHVERCSTIVHVLDCATLEPNRDPVSDYDVIEAELAAYGALEDRPRLAVLNKVDVPDARELAELVRVLRGTLDAVLGEVVSDSPFLRASRFFVPLLADVVEMEEMRAAEPGNEREATVAEVKSAQDLVHTYRLRYTGMLLRALEAEIGIGNGTPEIRARHRVLEEVYAKWTAAFAADTAADPIPLRDLVAIQYGTILAGARHAKT